MTSSSRTLLLGILFALTLIVGFLVALQPPPEGIDLGGGRDKIAHFAAFLLFALFGFGVWPARVPSVTVGLLTYGLAMEIAQDLSGRRMGDPLDLLADACGVLAALALRSLWLRLRPLTA